MKDPGTDLLNKRAITDYLRKLIDSQPGHTVTIAIIDIDDLRLLMIHMDTCLVTKFFVRLQIS